MVNRNNRKSPWSNTAIKKAAKQASRLKGRKRITEALMPQIQNDPEYLKSEGYKITDKNLYEDYESVVVVYQDGVAIKFIMEIWKLYRTKIVEQMHKKGLVVIWTK